MIYLLESPVSTKGFSGQSFFKFFCPFMNEMDEKKKKVEGNFFKLSVLRKKGFLDKMVAPTIFP